MSLWTTLPIVFGFAALLLLGCTGSPPATIGSFVDCPDSPNCVSTKAQDETHAIPPFHTSLAKEVAQKRIVEILHSLPRTHIVSEKEDYLHVEFTSRIFRFVDDVEFFFAIETGAVHFRSASRLGRSDLGVNRKRMETLRRLFSEGSP